MTKLQPEKHRQGRIWNLLTKEDRKKASAALLEIETPSRKQCTKKSIRYFFVIRGSGEVVIGSRKYLLEKGCFIVVPPTVRHQFFPRDTLFVLVFSIPPFKEEDVVFFS